MAARQPGLVNETRVGQAFSVKGQSAIITGAGSGINFSFAALLLSHGCSVLIADLSLRPEAEKLVQEYSTKEQDKPRAVFQKTDVTDWPQLKRMFEVGVQEFGKIDIVCPGAGVYEPIGVTSGILQALPAAQVETRSTEDDMQVSTSILPTRSVRRSSPSHTFLTHLPA